MLRAMLQCLSYGTRDASLSSMSQHYSDPSRESDPYALPNIEVFYLDKPTCDHCGRRQASKLAETCRSCGAILPEFTAGWYWQACFPGCLPDGEPCGPFDTEADAVADAQNTNE